MIHLIIGKRSNLSRYLSKRLDNTILIASSEIDDYFEKQYSPILGKISIIFNQFQVATQLNDYSALENYIEQSIGTTARILDYIIKKKIDVHKIIYTSSSSVYGNNTNCKETDEVKPQSMHGVLKASNEKLIEVFCKQHKVDYTVTRIFNMYGGKDNFSIISKIIRTYHNKEILTLINHGEAIRDYIHIDDVVQAYIAILKQKNIPIVNIGTMDGKSVLYLLNYLKNTQVFIETENIERQELKVSISDNKILLNIFANYTFKKVEDYISAQCKRKIYA